MKKLAILTALVLVLGLFAACGGSNSGSSSSSVAPVAESGGGTTADRAPEAVPAAGEGKEIVIGCKADTPYGTIDPVHEDGSIIWILQLAFEGLVKTAETADGSATIEPSLAESWEISDDGLTYTFKLKPGVMFWDGTPVTTEDWIWSLERARDTAESPWSSYAEPIASVTAPDESTLVIQLNELNAPFLSMLAIHNFAVHSKKHADEVGMEQYVMDPMGTGPFYIEEWSQHEYYRMRRNPNYHRDITTNAETLLFNVVVDDNTRIMQLQAGDIDVCTDLPPNRVAELEADSSIKVDKHPSTEQRYINFNVAKAPLDNADVRRALRMATDRDELIKICLFGYGEATYNVFPSIGLFFNDSIVNEGFDIEKAKQLLADAGYPDGFETEISYSSGNAVTEGVATLLKEQWAKIGVNLKVTALENAALSEQFQSLNHTMTILRWSEDTNDPSGLSDFIAVYDNAHGFHTGYQNPRLTELNAEAKSTVDPAKREAAYHEIQQILYDEAPLFPIWKVTYLQGVRSNVEGFSQTALGQYELDSLIKN